jgi:hypothetical protein
MPRYGWEEREPKSEEPPERRRSSWLDEERRWGRMGDRREWRDEHAYGPGWLERDRWERERGDPGYGRTEERWEREPWYGRTEGQRWERDPRYGRMEGERWREQDVGRPWVERWPDTHRADPTQTKGMLEWEDRGPLEWLGDKLRGRKHEERRGPKGFTRSDERITEDVCERLARSGVDARDVEVKVEKGEVTLTGTVGSRVEKWTLEEAADDAYGVVEVHNHLRISRMERGERTERGEGFTSPDVHARH